MSYLNYTIEREEGEIARREQIVDIVVSRLRFSETYFTGVRNRLPRLYDLWRGIWTGRFHPHKNNIHLPLIYSAIWSDAANKAAISLTQWPPLQFIGYGPDDMPVARKWESLVAAQQQDMGLYAKEVDNFVTADLYGVSISQLGWRRSKDVRIIESIETSPLSQQIIRSIRKGEVITFDGPDIEPVDRLDAFPQPGVSRLDNMKWFIRRRFIDIDECHALVKAGMFDKAELDRMIREGGVNTALATDLAQAKRFQVRTGMDDETARWMDRYTRPVEIVEFWGIVPNELADDGDTFRVITVANRRYLFRNKPVPFWHKRLPFLAYSPTPDPHYFDAPGKAEICEKLQIVANRYINQALDVRDLIVDPVWFYNRDSNLNTRNLYVRPGRFIPVDGDPNSVIAPMQANLANLAQADQTVEQLRTYIQMGSGIHDDVGQGLPGPDRETARGMLARREAAGTRLNLESLLYERTYYEPLGNMQVSLNKQFLETPTEVMILGDNAMVDPITQMPIVDTRTTISEDDMRYAYNVRAIGASSGLTKTVRQQNMIQLLQAMASPMGQMAMGAINVVNFWKTIFRDFDIPNINEIFQQNPMLMQQVGMTGAAGPGGVPSPEQMTGQVPIPGVGGQAPDMTSMLQGQQ